MFEKVAGDYAHLNGEAVTVGAHARIIARARHARNDMGKTSTRIVVGLAAIVLAISVARFGLNRIQAQGEANKKQASPHSVTLNWQPTSGAQFYYIYRSTVSGSQYQIIGTSPTPTFKDAPVPSGAVFYYVVTAVVNGRESKYSNETKTIVP
jgi:fibronectin type 3 domain-containing protein